VGESAEDGTIGEPVSALVSRHITSYFDVVYEHTSTPTALLKSQTRWNGRGWNLMTE
jgi:hypothetical protein